MGQVMSAIRASIRAFNVFPLLLSQFCYAAYSDTKQESDNVFNEICEFDQYIHVSCTPTGIQESTFEREFTFHHKLLIMGFSSPCNDHIYSCVIGSKINENTAVPLENYSDQRLSIKYGHALRTHNLSS